MEIKTLTNNILNFIIRRFIEFLGIAISIVGLLLLVALLSYSPEDPNFIFPDNKKIENLLGFKGSLVSDFFYQSLGLISILISVSIFLTGTNIVRSKKIFVFIENLFFTIFYSILGSLFFSFFYPKSFWLSINGNGGFIGEFLIGTFIGSIINLNQNIAYYLLAIIIISLFLISINFKLKTFLTFIKNIFNFLFKKKEINLYTDKENFNEYVLPENANESKNLAQESLPFSKDIIKNSISEKKFILPSIDLLKSHTKNQKEKVSNNNIDPNFLEKILLDFGVEGKIKKVSNGPVVTLNEFEPAAGVKVSKIINLSEDIARNTSSESARISTIPGSNTIGIELPNSSREDVYLNEIISHKDFSKKDIKLPIA